MARTPDLARRAELAEQALDIIRKRGVHQITMSDLAAGLGLKRPTLYFYFRDLGEVFEAVVEETQRRLQAFATERLIEIQHPIDLLAGVVQALLDFYADREDDAIVLFQLWATGGTREPRRAQLRAQKWFLPIRAQLVARLEDGIARGLVRPCDAGQIVDLTLALADGALMARITRDADTAPITRALLSTVLEPLRQHTTRRRTT